MSGTSAYRLYRRLLEQVVPYWRVFAFSVVSMVVLALTEPAIPALLKPTVDGSFVHKNLHQVGLMAVLLVALFLLRGLAGYAGSVSLAWVAGKVVMSLREAIFARVLALPRAYLDQQPTGRIVSRVNYDAVQVTEATTFVITVLVRDSIAIAGLLGWMLYVDWSLSLVALAVTPFVVLTTRYFSRRLRRMSHGVQQAMGDLTHTLEEVVGAQPVVRIYGGEAHEIRRFSQVANSVRRYLMKYASAAAASAPVAQFITSIALAIILYLAAYRSAEGQLSVGGFISFFTAMAMLFSPLKRLTGVNGPLQKGLAAAESIFALIDEAPEVDTGRQSITRARGALRFENVAFAYGNRHPALRDIDLSIEPGETVALVGPSGSGKTTLANLVARFYQPSAGTISLDGIPLPELTLASLRRNIATVDQNVVLFNDTVANNIAYGATGEVEHQRVRDAARAAQALEFVEALPDGFETLIGERGLRLSGGQRQRLAIARAFFKDAPLLILDEATSSLDSEAERHIQIALDALRRGRTTLVIAHRLSTIERADRILVLNEGRIAESGTHAELMRRNGLYAGLYRFQYRPQSVHPASAGQR